MDFQNRTINIQTFLEDQVVAPITRNVVCGPYMVDFVYETPDAQVLVEVNEQCTSMQAFPNDVRRIAFISDAIRGRRDARKIVWVRFATGPSRRKHHVYMSSRMLLHLHHLAAFLARDTSDIADLHMEYMNYDVEEAPTSWIAWFRNRFCC